MLAGTGILWHHMAAPTRIPLSGFQTALGQNSITLPDRARGFEEPPPHLYYNIFPIKKLVAYTTGLQ